MMDGISLSRNETANLEQAASALVGKLPQLLMEARRVAVTVAQGIHGRRRAGTGETFWQFRNFEQGDPSSSIDWRRSAGSSHLFVREREWEAAHTVWIWIDLSLSMHFRSHLASSTKAERALILAIALATLLSDAGERVGIPGLLEPRVRRNTSAAFLEAIIKGVSQLQGLPSAQMRFSKHSEIVIFSDFLEPHDELGTSFARIAQETVRGHLMQILDPAEETLPYQGRVEFYDPARRSYYTAERAETLRTAYAQKLAAHKFAIASSALRLGWTPFVHHTDHPAVEALLPLHLHLSGLEKAYRSKGMVKGMVGEGSLPA